MMGMKFKNVFFWSYVNSIGGVETFLWEIAKKYGKTHDITILYKSGDLNQIRRLKSLVRVRKWCGERIECEKIIFGLNTEILDYAEADEYIQMIHADYDAQKLYPCTDPRITRYIACSQAAVDGLLKRARVEAELSYNPITVVKPKRILRLISATRLTPEKGGERMKTFAQALESAGIPYSWEVFTTSHDIFDNPNIVVRKPKLDILPNIAAADYLVQLSDTEGYSYSILESLCIGTPVIVTDFPSAHEQVANGTNGFVLPMDMSEIPVDRIYKGLKKFKYVPKEDGWGEILSPGAGNYEEEKKAPVRIRTLAYYFDIKLEKHMNVGDEQEVTQERADKLAELGIAEIIY